MADSYLFADSTGELKTKEATVVSLGAISDGEIPALDTVGKLDLSVIPEIPLSLVGGSADFILETADVLVAGNFVALAEFSGVSKLKLSSNLFDFVLNKYNTAIGFVKKASVVGDVAEVFLSGPNTFLSGLTVGSNYYISTAGTITELINNNSSEVFQKLGRALTDSQLLVTIEHPIIRA